MVWFKPFLWLILALLTVLCAAAGVYVTPSFPKLDGELKSADLKALVSVTRDTAEVTHIKAQSPSDA